MISDLFHLKIDKRENGKTFIKSVTIDYSDKIMVSTTLMVVKTKLDQ